MDDPVPRRLRTARPGGLTSPDPVTAPLRPPAATRTPTPSRNPDKPQNRQAAESPHPIHCRDQINRPLIPSSHRPNSAGGSRLRWRRLMFLDDDIYAVSKEHVGSLASGLNDHAVSVLIPDEYPDNSVACHAHRLGGGEQGKFASGGGMGVRCDREDLAFFPNIYNEDWFFFAEEAASRKITRVGASRQREYDPFEDPRRAVKEEFGDLLAEGLYAGLDAHRDISGVDIAYWAGFIESRAGFLSKVAASLTQHPDQNLDNSQGRNVRAAQISIRAAQGQLERISPEICQRFIDRWQADLVEWRRYLTKLPHVESLADGLDHLGLDYAMFSPNIR